MKVPRTTKIVSLLLAVVFCLYLVPVEVVAAELRTTAQKVQSTDIINAQTTEDADIVSEIVSSRDKYQKEFLLSNGQHLLTVYPTAVHYEDAGGQWQEIDNTLKAATVNGKTAYRNTAGVWDVTLPSSLSGADAVSISRGDSTLSFRFVGQLLRNDVLTAQAVQMDAEATISTENMLPTVEDTLPLEENDAPSEEAAEQPEKTVAVVEPSAELDELQQEGEPADTQVASETEILLPENEEPDVMAEEVEELEQEDPVVNSDGETVVESSEEGAVSETEEESQPEEDSVTETVSEIVAVPDIQWETETTTKMGDVVYSRAQVQTAPISLRNSEIVFAQKDEKLQETFSDKLSSAAEYTSVFNGVNVRYDLSSNTLKESVIISSKPTNSAGYQYLLEVDNLVLELQEDNSIYAYAADYTEGDEPVFFMPAPYLYDQEHAYCDDIELVLKETSGGYLLTYLLPQEWMSDEERVYPVVLDPVVHAELNFTNIADQTVFSITQLPYTWSMLPIGQGQYGIGRSFLKYNNLPTLTSADVIVDATMALYKLQTSSTSSEIDVHKVNGTWESSTITWSNMPGFDTTVEDYQIAGAAGWYYWDVTDIAQEWYTGENTGMMFKMEDTQEAAATDLYREFCSSDYSAGALPSLSITYINNCGLENIWDYTTHSAGAAGTGYINDYTGNLVWVYSGLGFSGNRMPVAINHIYNANDKGSNDFGMGYGWRSNYNQLVYQWSENSDYFVWEDEDATRHYFKHKSDGTYEDEVNTGLILTTTGSGTTKYCITDKNGNKSYFDTSGRLTQITNNQATPSSITISYKSGKLISSITDGAGRRYQFDYTGTTLNSITFYGTGNAPIATESYTYSSSRLTAITSTLLPTASFAYTSNNLISQVSDANGYRLTYAYNTTSSTKPNRVTQVCEYDGTTAGGMLSIDYAHKQTTFTDHNDNQEIMQFNNFGSTVSVQDGEGMAQFYKYYSASDVSKASQLEVSSKLQNTVVNQIYNSNFELSGGWTASSGNASDGFWDYIPVGYIGETSLMISRSSSSGNYSVQPTSSYYCSVQPGKTYTLSAYVKTASMTGGGTGARLALTLSGSTVAVSQAITTTADWTRVEATYTHPATSAAATIIPCLQNGTSGVAYFDGVQFEESANASRYNLIENGDFRYSTGWTKNSACDALDRRMSIETVYTDETSAPQLDNFAHAVYGDATADKRISQTVPIYGSAGDVFTVAGWAKGDSVPTDEDNRQFAILARFNYVNGTYGDTIVAFNPNAGTSVNWQYVADRIVAQREYESITVSLLYSYNANVVYFDGIQLFKEEFGHSYVYDANGNVTSVTDLQKQTTTYEYSNNNLTTMTLPSGAAQTYTYDSYHNVKSATSPEGVVSNFTYDTYGNNTKVTVGSGTSKITATATYTTNGDQLSTVTDALGQTTSYGYDLQTGVLNWVQAPGETEATRTNYTLDDRYRTTGVSKGNSSVGYTYSNDLLSAITSASGTNYTFTYDVFDLIESVSIGNRNLISHTYGDGDNDGDQHDDNNYRLLKSEYGNGDHIAYTYDNLGRTSTVSYENKVNAIAYTYDNSGNLGIVKDNIAGRETKYFYDFQDRLMRYEEVGSGHSNTVQWGYDDENNLTSQTQTLNGTTYTTSYAYDDDNRLTQSTTGTTSANYTYDTYSRMTGLTAKSGTTSVVTTGITYKNPTSTTTSTQVYKWTTGGKTYTYTYDVRGNITAIADGTYTSTYVYDGLDQLTRENNQAAGKTWVYAYDNGGNILSKTEYAYTTGTLGTALDTITYGYSDSYWKDLLTSYDGQTLTSDNIGNLTNDGTWSYTWQHGRQLTQMTRANGAALEYLNYTYDADGRRIGKERETIVTVGGEAISNSSTTKYIYLGDTLTEMQIVNVDESVDTFRFTYDATGPMSMTFYGTEYFYLKNAQGDVTGIVNAAGTQVVAYTYDAWGKLLSTTGTMAGSIGTLNPFRYRGYVYDTETGLYYLNSRYYNPGTGRFINADGYVSTGQGFSGHNMFVYCGNNPAPRQDSNGDSWMVTIGTMLVGGLIGAVVSAVASVVSQKSLTGDVNWKSVGVAAATGFVSGAVAASPLGAWGQRIVGGIIGGLSYVADCYVNEKEMKLDEAVVSIGMGVVAGHMGGPGANVGMTLTNTARSAAKTIEREARRANQQYAQKAITAAVSYRNEVFASAAWSGSIKFAAATGVSSGITGAWSKANRFPTVPAWAPW